MENFYPLLLAFFFVFIAELGDKTQLLVLSFSTKAKTGSILLGVALGSLFSHGIAILFGSHLVDLGGSWVQSTLQLITYVSFLFIGIFTLCKKEDVEENSCHCSFLQKLFRSKCHYVLLVAFSIAIGELGDKTLFSSIGLGIGYPSVKLFLILGSVLGMVMSNFIAICFGKWINQYFSEKSIQKFSGILFLCFGIFSLFHFFFG